jgi:cardiolipin synthase A/B
MDSLTNIGFLLAGLLFGVLALIGVLDVVRGTPVARVCVPTAPSAEHASREDARPPAVDEPLFRDTIELLTRTTLRPGHAIDVFTNGDQTYPPLWADLGSAERSITVQMYYCKAGRMAERLREVLEERAGAGVAVYFLYDAFGSSLPKSYFASLRSAGVRVRPFRPLELLSLHKLQHRAHIRVVVVDGRVGYTGGFGIDDKWFGSGRHKDQWRDTNVRFTGPAVRQLQATFAACWAEATGDLLTGPLLFPPDDGAAVAATDGALAGLLHGSPSIGSTEAERFFALSIASARRTLYITNSYFVPDGAFRRLIAAAARRGVDTRVLTAGPETDVRSTLYAGRARYEELLRAGVRVYEYQPTMMHAKSIVVDGRWASVGSMNADNRSMSFNEESNLFALDADFGAQMERLFLEDLAHAKEIRLEEFRRRPWASRLVEQGAHLVWRVL